MRAFLDSAASWLAAVVTLVTCGGPAWFSHLAIQSGLVSVWAYASVALLSVVGGVLTFAFARKATRGIAPTRQRRR